MTRTPIRGHARRRTRWGLVLLLLWAVPGLPSDAAAVQLLAPRDGTLVREDTLLLLGTAERGRDVPWELEAATGTDQGTVRADWGDLFEVFVFLQPGLNRIRVGDRQLRVFYADRGQQPPAGFLPQRIHAGDISLCDSCHDPFDLSLLDGGYPQVCFGCHVVVSNNPDNPTAPTQDAHFRTAIADCGNCHEFHASFHPQLLRQPMAALCGRCHEAYSPETTTHAAYDEGGCAACHDAHYSGYQDVLLEPLPGLCQRCHDQGVGVPAERLHAPLTENASCATCHNPHGDREDLLVAPAGELCLVCHGGIPGRGHGAQLQDCTGCHQPHASRAAALLRVDTTQACARCHPGVGTGSAVHAALEDGCEGCHDPHRDGDRAAARTSCARCHDLASDRDLLSLHGNLTLPAASCSACHPPHSAPYERLVRGRLHQPLRRGKCSVCHGGGAERSILVQDVAGRCRMCHPFEQRLAEEGGEVHVPVAEGDCLACHDPHMSSHPDLLRDTQSAVCGECHDVLAGVAGSEPHAAAEVCTDCHAPHGGPGALFLSAPEPELCLECHEDPAQEGSEWHPALEEGCLVCHAAHTGIGPGLLQGTDPRQVCLDCHDDPTAGRPVVHGALEEGCSVCHTPHAGDAAPLLRQAGNGLCRECHDLTAHHTLDSGHAAQYPGAEAFPKDGGELACGGCHEPHAAEQRGLFVRPKEQLCQACHRIQL